jgi:hypothetical protein
MVDDGYQAGGTVGGRWGCALAALVGLPLLSGALIIASMGQCAPDAKCLSDWQLFGAAIAITATVGFGSRAAINAIIKRLRNGRKPEA